MKTIVSGKNIEITSALKEALNKKLGRIEKFFAPDTEAHVTLSVQKTRQIIEVTIKYNGVVFRAEEQNDDMYASIDKAIDVLERQIRKNKTRLLKKLKAEAFKVESTLPEDTYEEDKFNVVRTKRFAIKPMNVEEAILQMNLIGHEFFVFFNDENKQVNVVYKRKNGDYGLIEPEF